MREYSASGSSRMLVIFLLLAFSAGIFSGFFLGRMNSGTSLKDGQSARQSGDEYHFISPLLDCSSSGKDFTKAGELSDNIQGVIQENIDDPQIDHTAIFFRDLNNGPTFSINDEEEFSPASLLKVPLMIAYLKWSESDPELLLKKIKYEGETTVNSAIQNIKPGDFAETGKEYSAEELIEMMIRYSDNNSANLLLKNIDNEILEKVYSDLGIEIPGREEQENFMTIKDYAYFFRILYNSSYLSRQNSEKALEILSKSEYKNGLAAGIPSDLTVSHKFGERVLGSSFQLHDCGIVYKPGKPYLLCIMSRGSSFQELERVIQAVSRAVFEEINK